MARQGRPRKSGERYPSGKLKSNLEQMAEAEKDRANRERAIVLSQPHRRGDSSQLCENPLGRFILANDLRHELYQAGQQYANLKHKWQTAVGAPMQDKGPGGSGADIPTELVRTWARQILECEREMVRYGNPSGCLSVVRMAVYGDAFAPGADKRLAVRALMALAVHLGRLDPRLLTR